MVAKTSRHETLPFEVKRHLPPRSHSRRAPQEPSPGSLASLLRHVSSNTHGIADSKSMLFLLLYTSDNDIDINIYILYMLYDIVCLRFPHIYNINIHII